MCFHPALKHTLLQKLPIHVVGEDEPAAGETTVVTAYEPDAKRWQAGFRERKKKVAK